MFRKEQLFCLYTFIRQIGPSQFGRVGLAERQTQLAAINDIKQEAELCVTSTENKSLSSDAQKLAAITQNTGLKNKVIGVGIAVFWGLLISIIAVIATINNNAAPYQSTNISKSESGGAKKIRLAFVTNNPSDYWTIARKGTEKAAAELPDFTIYFKIPSDGTAAEQTDIVNELVSGGIDGIAISPVDPTNQTQLINDTAKKTLVITQDADAPESNRALYIGTDNVAAGRQAGQLIKEALPNGGKIMVFVGKIDAQNAKERYQGIQEALKDSKVEIVDIRTDDTDFVRAKSNVADALVKNKKLAGLVGLWSYNGPAILNAVKDAHKVGKIKIICFDEEDQTLVGIKEGAIYGTIVQQPFEFGYQSIKMLAQILNGDKSKIPADKQLFIETKSIRKDNVEEFTRNLNQLRGRS